MNEAEEFISEQEVQEILKRCLEEEKRTTLRKIPPIQYTPPFIDPRTMIAAMCLQGLLASEESVNSVEIGCRNAVRFADQLIKELEKKE